MIFVTLNDVVILKYIKAMKMSFKIMAYIEY